ncbi:class III signal peptide-containing protein [Methanococcus sp. CF]
MSKGQVSVEFIVLFLALLVAVVVSTMTPGIFGLNKTVELSSASLAHAALSKVKNNIELLAASDKGSSKLVYVKSPISKWEFDNHTVSLSGDGYNVSTNTTVALKNTLGSSSFSYNITSLKIVTVTLTRMDDYVQVSLT